MSYGRRVSWMREQDEERLPLVMFDMDGTLTEPRMSVDTKLLPAIESL